MVANHISISGHFLAELKEMRVFKASRNAAAAIAFVPLACVLFLAQQPQVSGIDHYEQQIAECNRVIANWQWQADLQIVFVLLIVTFGALITIFQGLKNGWCKPATLALGACTTILTTVNAKVFTADYRVLQQSVIDGNQIVDQLKGIVDDLRRPNVEDVPGLRKQWIVKKTEFAGLQKAVLQGTNKTAALVSLMKSVYAQSKAPTWIAHPPTDAFNLYFAGIGEDRNIEVARQRSLEAAVAAGAAEISAASGTDREVLRQVIASSAATDKSYFEFDKSKGVYRFYTLLRISNDIKQFRVSTGQRQTQSAPMVPSESRSVVVPGKNKWTSTGIQVNKGDTISFTAAGQVQWTVGKSVGPEGSTEKLKARLGHYPVSTRGAGALIGRIGSGPAFAVGNSAKIVATESGPLYLGINDNFFANNGGEFSVNIVRTPSGETSPE